jgi:hypothetical protein
VTIFATAAQDDGECHDGGVKYELSGGLREWQKETFTSVQIGARIETIRRWAARGR